MPRVVNNSFPVIRTANSKNRHFHVPQPIFLFPLETPLRLSRRIRLVVTLFKSMRKSKNRYFHHIFVFPGDAPGEITLNVVWMERKFDAYKLSRCMCRSNYYRF